MEQYRLRIASGLTPETLPMERLAEYMSAYARLLGESESVHFRGLETGSAVLVARVELSAQARVQERLRDLALRQRPNEAARAYEELDEMLRKDDAAGELTGDDGVIVLPFPGRMRPEPLVFGPIRQEGSLEGQVIRVGGKDDTIPVHLRDGDVIHSGLNATPELARRLAQHLLGPVVRVYGSGTWYRQLDGTWFLKNFRITDFELLEDDALEAVVASLRKIKGSSWSEVPDPVRVMLDERHGGGDAH